MTTQYDAIVIGSGQSGNPLATALAKSGKKTVLIEAQHIGGCCINDGCTPTKTMISSGRVAYLARRGPKDYGVHFTGGDGQVRVDMERVRGRKREIVESFAGGSTKRLKDAGVEVIWGVARFTGEKKVRVRLNEGGDGERVCEAAQIFLNTGERPAVPELEGLKEVMEKVGGRVLDSTSIQELGEVPTELIVLGGGYIGLEFGQLFQRFGAKVTIVQRAATLAPREDAEITECLKKILEEDGVRVLVSTSAVKVSLGEDESICLVVKSQDGKEMELRGSHMLLATGRRPNTDMLDLDKAGIKYNKRGYVLTNDTLETSASGTYALGDVRGGPAFTHISYDDFRILRDTLGLGVEAKSRSVKSREGLVPYCMFTDPQLAHVGLHLKEISEAERKYVQVAQMPMSWVARALETDETRGMMKAIIKKDTGHILGFTCLGLEGGELMSAVQLAMMGGLKYWDLENAVFAHPTIAECLNNLWGTLKDV